MSKRVLIVPDLQIPFHDRRAVKALIGFVGDTQPDEVVMIGDVLDFPQPSRWNKDTKGEFEGSIYKDVEMAKRQLFEPLRAGYDGPVMFHEGNHDERARVYLDKYAPALSGTSAFNIDVLCDFDAFNIELLPEVYNIAPGWVSTHGHKQNIKLSQKAGDTALNAAKKFRKSVVMGHTHRLGLVHHSDGHSGRAQVLTGFEVGNMMDMRQAGYLKGGTANWQSGFGILDVDAKSVQPIPVLITGRRFSVDGHTWEI